MKKVLKITLIVFLVIIVALVASAFIFQDKIINLVKTEINKNIDAEVDFNKVNVSFFRSFPRVSLGLDDLRVTGKDIFVADTLLSAKRLDVAVDIMSFFRGSEMKIYSIFVDEPRIHALITKEGEANWNIVKETPDEPESASEPFQLNLKKYEIRNGYVFYDDKEGNMSAEVWNLNHKGSGDFNADLFTLVTKTNADAATYTYNGVPFIFKAKTDMDAEIKIDNNEDKYSFENLTVFLNDLEVKGDGYIKMLDEAYEMDINFKTPGTDFKHLLSMIPTVYKQDFDKVTASGSAAFQGNIKGVYSERSMPGYHVAIDVKNGAFKYPDLPKGIEQVNLNAVIENPDGVTDNTVVNVSDASLKMGHDPFSFRLLLKKPETAMFVDAAAKGRLDLNQVGQFVKLEKGTTLAGLLNADVEVKGNVSDLEKQQFQNFYAGGSVDINGFNYTSTDYPTGVRIDNFNTTFTPSKIDISKLKGEYLKTRFDATGHINNLLNYMLSDKPLSATLTLSADKVNLNDWMGVAEDTSSAPTGDPFVVPSNLDIVLNTNVGEVTYDKINIKNLSGALKIAGETVNLNDVKGNALDGVIAINGSYSTKDDKKKPAITMSYNVDKVDIQKAFYAFNTVQKLMPMGKFLSGSLTSSLSANGKLGEGMEIDMNTLSGAGNLLLIEGVLNKFTPLEKIANTLNVVQLKEISLKDVKAFFEFSNGKMLVKPFNVKVKDIEMEIGGLHGFDESIDYSINMKLPRELLGDQGNQLVNNLASAVSSKGIPVNLGETVNLKLQMGGTIKNPTLKTDLKQTGETLAAQMQEQVKEFAQAKIDSAKSAIADTISSVKKQLTDAAKDAAKDELKQLLGQTDSTKTDGKPIEDIGEKAKESAKGLLQGLLKKKKDTTKVD